MEYGIRSSGCRSASLVSRTLSQSNQNQRTFDVYHRIPVHTFHVEVSYQNTVIFRKSYNRGLDPGTPLHLCILQLDEPTPGPRCHPDWQWLYIDRVWVSRDVGFWAQKNDCLAYCGVGAGTTITALHGAFGFESRSTARRSRREADAYT